MSTGEVTCESGSLTYRVVVGDGRGSETMPNLFKALLAFIAGFKLAEFSRDWRLALEPFGVRLDFHRDDNMDI